MRDLIKDEANRTFTENGAVTNGSTGSDCLDLFASIGALRGNTDEDIITRFVRAFTEDSNVAMKILFFARDIRGGLGERRTFRVILRWLADNEPSCVIKNMDKISEYGRWDDLLCLFGTECESEMLLFVRKQFENDIKALAEGKEISLLGKWLPSVNASNSDTVRNAKRMAGAFGLNDAGYRKALSALRENIHIIENNLREADYSFDYEKQPSRAMYKYRKAFFRNDGERYRDYLLKVNRGEAVLHTDNVAPYELVEPFLRTGTFTDEEKKTLNTTWNSLPDFGNDENALAVIDTSGSMYNTYNNGCAMPAAIALSLGLYFAEHNKGVYKNCFIEFSERPQMIEIKGDTFADKLRYIYSFNEVADTNLEAVFRLLLYTAIKNKVPQEELPTKLIIISDMEFNECVLNAGLTNFENTKKIYENFGYKLPEIVFWNAASRNIQQPVTRNEQGVALVSGVTPRIFSMIAGGILSPYTSMMEILGSERYTQITA